MLFNSLTFLCFFLAVLAGYWLARTRNTQLNWLLCCSVLFYASWSWLYALIFLGLISLNYAATLVLHRGRSRSLLAASRDRVAAGHFLREVRWREAFWWICLGLCKKVLIADYLAAMADAAFDNPGKVKSLTTLFAVHAFTFQIYCDFSGYSNIARGLGLLMGFDLIHNFNMPYVSKNMREFWQRWHISLSRWLRDYLYIPFGGNRGGLGMTCRNLMLTMGLGGLWHGASWTFVLWGCYHGALLMTERLWDRFSRWKPRIPGWIAVLAIYHLAALGWVFFRTHTMHDLQLVFHNLGEDWEDLDRLRSWRGLWERNFEALIALGVAIAGQIVASRVPPRRFWNMPAWALGLILSAVVTVLTILAPGNREFIYFQF